MATQTYGGDFEKPPRGRATSRRNSPSGMRRRWPPARPPPSRWTERGLGYGHTICQTTSAAAARRPRCAGVQDELVAQPDATSLGRVRRRNTKCMWTRDTLEAATLSEARQPEMCVRTSRLRMRRRKGGEGGMGEAAQNATCRWCASRDPRTADASSERREVQACRTLRREMVSLTRSNHRSPLHRL